MYSVIRRNFRRKSNAIKLDNYFAYCLIACLICTVVCNPREAYADVAKQPAQANRKSISTTNEIVLAISHNSGIGGCTVKRSIKSSSALSTKITYAINNTSGKNDSLLKNVSKITFEKNRLGHISDISCNLVAKSSQSLLASLKENYGKNDLRAYIIMLLLAFGDAKPIYAEDVYSTIRIELPDCELKATVSGADAKHTVNFALMPGDSCVTIQRATKDLSCLRLPLESDTSDTTISWCVWLAGDMNKPDGTVLTCSTPTRFGAEFDGVIEWIKTVRVPVDKAKDTNSCLDRLLGAITATNSKYFDDQEIDMDEYRNQTWSWRLLTDDSGQGRHEIGSMEMVLLREGDDYAVHNWRQAIFTLHRSAEYDLDAKIMIPERIKCFRNTANEISDIEVSYTSDVTEIDVMKNPHVAAQFVVSLLMSTGVCDAAQPNYTVINGVLPIGWLTIPVNRRTIIELRSGASNAEFFRSSLGDMGFNSKLEPRITWIRSLDHNHELPYAYKGQFEYLWKDQPYMLQVIRIGYGNRAGDPFTAPPLANFATQCQSPSMDSSEMYQKIWLIRTRPSRDYFVQWSRQQIEGLRSETKNVPRRARVESLSAERLNQLLTWLSIEDTKHVWKALIEIARAKEKLAERVADFTDKKISWDDIAPLLDRPYDDLPRPSGGEYILGDTILQAPDYKPQ